MEWINTLSSWAENGGFVKISTPGNPSPKWFLLPLEKSRSIVLGQFYINLPAWFMLCSSYRLWIFFLTCYSKLHWLLWVNHFHSKDSDLWTCEISLASVLHRQKVEITTLETQTLSNYTETKQAKLLWLVFLNQLNLLMCKHFSLAEYWNEMF